MMWSWVSFAVGIFVGWVIMFVMVLALIATDDEDDKRWWE